MLNLISIILPDKVFLCHKDQTDWSSFFLDSHYLYDGEKAKTTHKKGWIEVKNLPKKIERIVPPKTVTVGYKLREGFVPSEKLPAVVDVSFFKEDVNFDDEFVRENEDIYNLYEAILEQSPESYKEEEFEIVQIAHKNSDWKFINAPKGVQHYTLDEIANHPSLLQDTRCFLSSEESYKRIREFVKLNINPQFARVSSDYNFHFEVCKVIQLHKKEKYQRNVKPFAKRPKYVDDYRVSREISIFDIVPNEKEKNQSYGKNSHIAPKFEGASYEDLEVNIQEYLNELIAKINEPAKDCPHCEGKGVICG